MMPCENPDQEAWWKLLTGKTIQDGKKTISQTLDFASKKNHHFTVYKTGSDERPNRQK